MYDKSNKYKLSIIHEYIKVWSDGSKDQDLSSSEFNTDLVNKKKSSS
jgi:hypothetical protein